MRCQNHSQSSHQFSCHSQKHADVNNTNLSSLRIIFNEKHAEKQYLEKVTAAHRRRDDDDNDDDDVNSNDKKVFCNIIQCQSNIYNNNQHRFYTGDTPVIRAIFIPPPYLKLLGFFTELRTFFWLLKFGSNLVKEKLIPPCSPSRDYLWQSNWQNSPDKKLFEANVVRS